MNEDAEGDENQHGEDGSEDGVDDPKNIEQWGPRVVRVKDNIKSRRNFNLIS